MVRRASSSETMISSIFSPGRIPVTSMGTARSPTMARATFITVAAGARGTIVSPARAVRSAAKTVSTATSRLSRKRVISGTVTVTGPPRAIWSRKSGMTDPREASTFP